MIGRLWRGWTATDEADAYEELLRNEVLPGILRIDGCRGAYALRREGEEGTEFVTLTLWDSMNAIRRFAGEEYETAVVPEKAQALLARYDKTSVHYEVILAPD